MITPPVLKLFFGAGGVEQRASRGVSGFGAKEKTKNSTHPLMFDSMGLFFCNIALLG